MSSFNQRTQPSTFFWLTPGHPTSPAPYSFRWEELPGAELMTFDLYTMTPELLYRLFSLHCHPFVFVS